MTELQMPNVGEAPVEEKEEEPALTHWPHPTDSTICWCGKLKDKAGFGNGVKVGGLKTCPLCNDLLHRFGGNWWWDTHRRHYESNCHIYNVHAFHDCVGVR